MTIPGYASNAELERAFGTKALRYAERQTVDAIDRAIKAVTDAIDMADDKAVLRDILKGLEYAKEDIEGNW